jgi:hypothetical protein
LTPDTGSSGGTFEVTLIGSGFDEADLTVVHFGSVDLTGDSITVLNETTITVTAPPNPLGLPVRVSVETSKADSNFLYFKYVAGVPIAFDSNLLLEMEDSPTTAKFGPDGKLYVGTASGKLAKFTLNDNYTDVTESVISTVAQWRFILGLAFDPLDTGPNPTVYFTSNFFFHGGISSSSGESINGKVHAAIGSNMWPVIDIITGLPVSDHDHGVTALEFGDHGELYIGIGSNTNGGIPGALSGSQLQKESYYSAATLVAYVSDPAFDGHITYDADDDGIPVTGNGIEVFAAGMRNPLGLTLHSNGYLYGTDNGPNLGYGDMSKGCEEGNVIADVETEDKLNLILQGGYYGHPNRIRALMDSDPRQCVYHNPEVEVLEDELPVEDFRRPIVKMDASCDGIIEWQSDHFEGQLRGNLIASKYQDELKRVILTPDGTQVIPETNPALPLILTNDDDDIEVYINNKDEEIPTRGLNGLDITQAPDGTLIEVSFTVNSLFYHKPVEPATVELVVKSVFPRRGTEGGGNILSVYGVNMDNGNGQLSVTVGGNFCLVSSVGPTKIECTLVGGSGTVDVTVTTDTESSTMKGAYRYITGMPAS